MNCSDTEKRFLKIPKTLKLGHRASQYSYIVFYVLPKKKMIAKKNRREFKVGR